MRTRGSVDVVNVATPAASGMNDAIGVAPSITVTVPAGISGVASAGVTWMVNVTPWLNAEGFGVDVIVVVVGLPTTAKLAGAELLVVYEKGPLVAPV